MPRVLSGVAIERVTGVFVMAGISQAIPTPGWSRSKVPMKASRSVAFCASDERFQRSTTTSCSSPGTNHSRPVPSGICTDANHGRGGRGRGAGQ